MTTVDVLEQYGDRRSDARSPLAGQDLGTPYDETFGADGALVPSADLVRDMGALGAGGLRSLQAGVRRLVSDDGITYGVAPEGRRAGRWRLDALPVILDRTQWQVIESGLSQRAELLDALLTDLYGPQRLLADGTIPAAVVFGHAGFLPAAYGTSLPGPRQLILPSTDLARDAHGQWTALGDRAQAPSGAGYAMADRRIVARALPGLYRTTELSRLRGFFDDVRDALLAVAHERDRQPRVVLLSPGPASETAFDQAFVATLLGLPLVQSEDLGMRDGKVWLRTTGREEQVDVILRRVDASWSDPLDLRAGSRLGIPGLVEATRSGHVSVVNPLGAGVLENPALAPYLDRACRALLGEELRLPSVRTLWCGDEDARREGLARLGELVITPIDREAGEQTVFGWERTHAQLSDLKAQIEGEPWRWTLQEPVAMSTTPVVADDGLAPRRLVLRAFGVASDDGYRWMPGGLGRLSRDETSRLVSNAAGGQAKDVWVLASADIERTDRDNAHLWLARPLPGMHRSVALAPRAAGDLFWLGRYTERAESSTRLALICDDLVADHLRRSASPGYAAMAVLLAALTELTTVRPGFTGTHAEAALATPVHELRILLSETTRVGTIAYDIEAVVRTAHAARELLSVDTWRVLGRLQEALDGLPDDAAGADDPVQGVLGQALELLIALAGLNAESMVRDLAWAFLDAGRRTERALRTVDLLRHTLAQERPPVVDGQLTESVLRACDSLITHRRRLTAGQGPASPVQAALDLLLLDPANPRSVRFQLDQLEIALREVPNVQVTAQIADIRGLLTGVDLDEICAARRAGLQQLGHELHERLTRLGAAIEDAHFGRPSTQQTMRVSELIEPEGMGQTMDGGLTQELSGMTQTMAAPSRAGES
ncbi:circularly permuted type 2 ATP-grasp protein [Allobranchiibius sp. CTAmp26]|uniref:circularly permuted type 2 ATP-grasp protein n=1 Tax=Allobranchiibius sp. CTAmp26 TaxID=2815214 RepID=UPI001AA105C7|nr:circularly permuted type 2 ATP-grasp protein [Allobranchiibius sp. CTAmp26]MBO1754617.1 circularly permuted type 2 ATP-grasp protein [Allobranchiibius sp. CTAmp26]